MAQSTQGLRQQKAVLEAQYQQKRTFMKPDHPEMVSLQSQMNELKRQIAGQVSTASSGRLNGLLADYKAALSSEQALQALQLPSRSQVTAVAKMIVELEERIERLEDRIDAALRRLDGKEPK